MQILCVVSQKSFSFWSTSSIRPPTGALPLYPAGGLPSPRLLLCPPNNHVRSTPLRSTIVGGNAKHCINQYMVLFRYRSLGGTTTMPGGLHARLCHAFLIPKVFWGKTVNFSPSMPVYSGIIKFIFYEFLTTGHFCTSQNGQQIRMP